MRTLLKNLSSTLLIIMVSFSLSFGSTPEKRETIKNTSTIESESSEPSIQVWMVDNNYWFDLAVEKIEIVDTENSNTVSDWMSNTSFWYGLNIDKLNTETLQTETTVVVEEWMSETNYWNPTTETTPSVLSWMSDTSYWNN